MRYAILLFGLFAFGPQLGHPAWAAAPAAKPPAARRPTPQAEPPGTPTPPIAPAQAQAPERPAFDAWLSDLVMEAQAKGFSDELIDDTLTGLEPLPRVIQNDRTQAELNPGFGRYLSSRLTPLMVRRGREESAKHQPILRQVERRFDVQRRFLLAIWGLETRFGRNTGRTPVFRALATLAWEPRRAAFFRGELFDALTMVSRGHIDAPSMTGSWAGAMGQTQFMPSSYLKYAVDVDGDGRRDIWRSTADALGSIASYLKGYGWTREQTWGREVRLSTADRTAIGAVPRRSEGCYAIRNMSERLPLEAWRKMGVHNLDGSPLPKADITAGLVDVGERQFLVYPNYDAILGYNCAHYYALTVALLADRLK